MLERVACGMENKRFGNLGEYAKESAHKEYVYSRLPENIRQIGETNGSLKIYIEDYVMTYIHQIFTEKQEKAIVVFLGKKGREQATGCVFIYGAVQVQCDIMEGPKGLTANKWNQVYEEMNECFPGAQMLGWGCGVSNRYVRKGRKDFCMEQRRPGRTAWFCSLLRKESTDAGIYVKGKRQKKHRSNI